MRKPKTKINYTPPESKGRIKFIPPQCDDQDCQKVMDLVVDIVNQVRPDGRCHYQLCLQNALERAEHEGCIVSGTGTTSIRDGNVFGTFQLHDGQWYRFLFFAS